MTFDIQTIAAILSASGVTLVNIDENTTGADDYAGELLIYAGDTISAIHNGEDLPPLPPQILNGADEKITGAARVSLQITATLIPFLSASAPGKYRTALRYLSQAINQLLAGKAVPPMPASVISTLQPANK